MIKETNFYHISSINSDFDMQKVKLTLSDFTDIEDTLGGVLGYDVLHFKNIYNNRLFIEEINKEVDVNIEYLVVSTGYVMTCCVVKAEIKDLNNTDFFKSFISKKRKFKDSELESFDNFPTNLFNEKLLNLQIHADYFLYFSLLGRIHKNFHFLVLSQKQDLSFLLF